MSPTKTAGLIAAPFTPMRRDRTLNLNAVAEYARWLRQQQVVGAFICGTTGEGMSLTVDERRQLAERWVAAAPAGLRVAGKPPSYSLYVSQVTSVHTSFTKAYAPLPAFIGFSGSSGIAAAMLCVDYPANLALQEGPRKVRI